MAIAGFLRDAEASSSRAAIALPVRMRDVVYEIAGKRLIDGLSLSLRARSRCVVMGPNGSGKSLTLRILQGLLQPTSGTITWSDGAPGHAERRARRSAIVMQRPVLLRRSVAANLEHALAVYGERRSERRGRVEALLAMAELEHLAARPARVLSGGEQQRLSVVRALAAEPALLLLDEPTASLDPRATAMIEALIDRAHRQGVGIALVTHDIGQARRTADEVVFLSHGRVAEAAPARAFFAGPRSEAAAAYLDGRLFY